MRFPAVIEHFRQRSNTARGVLAMIGASLAFAITMGVVRHLSSELHPFEIAFFRNALGLLFILPWLFLTPGVSLQTRRPLMHVGRAACGITAMLCLFSAISVMPLAEVTAVTFTSPLFATAGAALILRETVRLRRWTATIVGFIGVLIILRPGAAVVSEGTYLAVLAAAFMAGAVLFVKSLSNTEHPTTIVAYFGLLLTPLSLIPAIFVWQTPALHHLPWFLLLGFTATATQLLLARAFVYADASLVMPFDFTRLIFATVIGAVFFAEQPDIWTWTGAAIIVASSAYVAHRERRVGSVVPSTQS